ncbi:MAG: ribosome small subunit-dependent GTPase A, partial [Aquabacterium sp.]|nr:ribosome small subunit-dependent GTPase A [Aquabacterium sp.]
MKRPGKPSGHARRHSKGPDTSQCQRGLVVAKHGRHVIVEDEAGERLICHP